MSLLFNIAHGVDVCFSVKLIPEKHGIDTALVGKDIWRRLGQSLGSDRIALPICPVRPKRNIRRRDFLETLTCWALLDEEVWPLFVLVSVELHTNWHRLWNCLFHPDGCRLLVIYFH